MQAEPHSQPSEKIDGIVERVTYHNAENGYCVLRIKVKGHKELVTVLGFLSSVSAGETLEAWGGWIQNRDFGLQFKAQSLKTIPPSTLEGIEKYLGSGLIKGIGPHFAKKLVQKFQFRVFDVIDKAPDALRRIDGIGPGRVAKIRTAWQDQKAIREIMVFLQSHGVSTSKAVRIYKTYGDQAIARVTANPYQLARDITGIGFKSADIIAEKLGIAKNSLIRARAGLHHVLWEHIGQGHSAYPQEDLLTESSTLLEIDEPIIREAAGLEIQEGHLIPEDIQGQRCLYPASLHFHESEVAKLLMTLNEGIVPWGKIDSQKAVTWVSTELGIELAPLQQEAIRKALASKVTVITGGPGTGKTTLTRSLITILKKKKITMALCSPTGRAAKRLSECTGMEAKTIHRLLKVNAKGGDFLYNQTNPLPVDLLILDEASMVDIALMHSLLKALPAGAALVIVGDVDQIPSVGPGHVLKAIIDSKVIPTIRLTEIYRQAASSLIIQSAHRINQGELPDLSKKDKSADFHFIPHDEPEKILETILALVKERIPKAYGVDPARDIQVLSPMNRGSLGMRALNLELQKVLNPSPSEKVERFGTIFGIGDKVMVTANDYDKEVFNGDIGFIKSIDAIEQETAVEIDGREVIFDFGEMDILSLAYAVTIHKSQGSEYPVIVMPLAMQHFMMLKRNLIYTGVTRGRKLVVIVGQKKALGMAVRSKNQEIRWNRLAERLIADNQNISTK